jgi:hypothetical protein
MEVRWSEHWHWNFEVDMLYIRVLLSLVELVWKGNGTMIVCYSRLLAIVVWRGRVGLTAYRCWQVLRMQFALRRSSRRPWDGCWRGRVKKWRRLGVIVRGWISRKLELRSKLIMGRFWELGCCRLCRGEQFRRGECNRILGFEGVRMQRSLNYLCLMICHSWRCTWLIHLMDRKWQCY